MTDEKKNNLRSQSKLSPFPDPVQIRQQAEQKAKAMPLPDLDAMTREEIQHMFTEMQVRQLEMEVKVDQLQKRLEETDDQAAILKTFSENTLDMIILTDIEGKLKFVGKSVEILGYETDSLLGKNVMDFVHPEDLPHCLEAYQELVASAVPTRIEYRFRCKDGSYLWIETRGSMVRGGNTNAQEIVFSSRDITARKQAEEAFRESKNKFYLLAEEAPVSIMHFDEYGIVKFVNKWHIDVFAKGMLGRDFFINKKITDLPGIQRAGIGPELEKILKGETVVLDDVHIPKFAVGHEGYQFIRGVPFFYNGEISGGILIREDITERKQAEEEQERLHAQLNQAQRMESVGRLAGGVAHDFNNKLTIINGYAEMAIDMMDPSDPLRKTIQEIYAAGNQSALIIRQLLAFARKQTISPVVLDLNDTISSMLKMLQSLIGENIALAWHPGKNLYRVKMDPSQVDQIMANLSLNARDAISDVGKLTIETKNTVVDEDYCKSNPEAIPGRYVMLVVSDDGCGMEKEVKDQLFEPFFTTKDVGEGSGLGLPTVYGIVKQNNGFINVYSEPGEGTIFKIYLPRHEEQELPAPEHLKEFAGQRPTGSETILLVEDDRSVLHMGRVLLKKLGYTVLTAEAPDDALQLAEAYDGKIDLLITDVIMPEMNGRDLAMRINLLIPEIKTIYISSYAESAIAQLGVFDKGVHYIQKPFSVEKLAVKVREVVEQE